MKCTKIGSGPGQAKSWSINSLTEDLQHWPISSPNTLKLVCTFRRHLKKTFSKTLDQSSCFGNLRQVVSMFPVKNTWLNTLTFRALKITLKFAKLFFTQNAGNCRFSSWKHHRTLWACMSNARTFDMFSNVPIVRVTRSYLEHSRDHRRLFLLDNGCVSRDRSKPLALTKNTMSRLLV